MQNSRDNSPSRNSDKKRETQERGGQRNDAPPPLRVITSTEGSIPPNSPVHELSKLAGKLAFGESTQPEDLSPRQEDSFPWDSDLGSSSRSSLNDFEKQFTIEQSDRRAEQMDDQRIMFRMQIQDLRKHSYTTAMNVVDTYIYAAKQIDALVQYGNKRMEKDIIKRFAGKPLDLALYVATELDSKSRTNLKDKYFRWVKHYESNPDLISRAFTHKTGFNLDASLKPDGTPLVGPIEFYNKRREALKNNIDQHNASNEQYNNDHPHLSEHYKFDSYDYTDNAILTPEIPSLPPLGKALEEKIWERHENMCRDWEPARPNISKTNLNQMFALGDVRWEWDPRDVMWTLKYSKRETGS